MSTPAIEDLEEGSPCTQEGCDGHYDAVAGRNCSCHISPPCYPCVEDGLECDECGHRPYDDAHGVV